MVKPGWFRRYLPDELPTAFERLVQSWDTANKASELSDFRVCTNWGIKGRRVDLLDVLLRRLEYPELTAACSQRPRSCGRKDTCATGWIGRRPIGARASCRFTKPR